LFILAEALTLKPNVYPDENAGEDCKRKKIEENIFHVIFIYSSIIY
jgi:hypothetical protein